jgi:hypothetical protein
MQKLRQVGVLRLIAHMDNELFFFFDTFFSLSNKAVALEQPSIQTHKEPQTKYHGSIDHYYCYTHNVTLTRKLCRLFDVKPKTRDTVKRKTTETMYTMWISSPPLEYMEPSGVFQNESERSA